jgi:predicted secreted protein
MAKQIRAFAMLSLLFAAWPAICLDPVATLESSTPLEICPECRDIRILLRSDPKAKVNPAENPLVEGVYLGGVIRAPQKFSAAWMAGATARGVDIKLDTEQLKAAGVYDLFLNLQPQSSPDSPRLKVQIVHPAPKLSPIPKLIVDRTYLFPFLHWDDTPPFWLHEASKKSALTIQGIVPSGNVSLNNKSISGSLSLSSAAKPIESGGNQKLDYALSDGFGLGTASGSMRVDAAELMDPAATFDFEVRSHVHWIYIGLTVAAGLIASYFLKVCLQQKVEMDQATLDARRLIEQITLEESSHADTEFLASYRNQMLALNEALNGSDPALINTAKTALDTVWRAQLQELAKRRQAEQDELNKFDFISYDWQLPAAAAAPILEARAILITIRADIERDDLAASAATRKQMLIDLGDRFLEAAVDWQGKAAQALNALVTAKRGISPAIHDAFQKPAQDVAAALKRIDPAAPLDTPAKIQDAIGALRAGQALVKQAIGYLRDAMQTELSEANSLVKRLQPPAWDNAAWDALTRAIADFLTYLATMAGTPDPASVQTRLDVVHQAWISALQGQFTVADAGVEADLTANRYIDALQTAIAAKRPPGHAAFGAVGARVPFQAPAFPQHGPDAPVSVQTIRTTFQTLFTPAPSKPTSVTDQARLKKDKRSQSLVVGLILIVAAYGLQLNTFVGSFTDFSTLFFWAFGLDLTVDALTKVTKKT